MASKIGSENVFHRLGLFCCFDFKHKIKVKITNRGNGQFLYKIYDKCKSLVGHHWFTTMLKNFWKFKFCVYKFSFLNYHQASIMYEIKIIFPFYKFVPCIASDVKELTVFQRKPNWVPLREDYSFLTWLKVWCITLQLAQINQLYRRTLVKMWTFWLVGKF